MVFLYYADSARSVVLLLYLVVFVFGLFRLKVWEFLFLSVFAVVNYAAIILLLYKFRPESINEKTDVLNIMILIMVLPWFSLLGGYITKLRAKISNAFSTIEQMTNNIQDVIFVLDMNLKYTYISPSVKIMRGYEPEEVLKQQSIEQTLTPSSMDLAMKTLSDVMELEKIKHTEITESRTLQLEMRRKDGTTVWTEVKFSFIRDENQRPVGILGVTRDITERKQAEEALKKSEQRYLELSIIDDLTQLYNSRHFYAQLKREIERSNRYEQPLTLLMLDLDKFKAFNDTYGHVEGDYVLSRLGQVVKRCLRETDSAYRYGGEEFTIMLPMTAGGEGIVTAKRIQTELRKEAFSPVFGKEVYMTVSIGLAQYKPRDEMKAFVHRVDQLMYQAKKNGRDRICPDL
jgi:diguanylate cyclase (GGDEF)-like protein/PAS domain S-box-containing protein